MKIIFFDIDGTLIAEGTQLMPESAKSAIRKAREKGHICIINTGRTLKMVGKEVTGQVEFDGLLMGCGTMVVYHDEVLMHKTFSVEQSLRIMEGLERHGIDAILEGAENNYCAEPGEMNTDTFRNYVLGLPEDFYTGFDKAPGKFDKFFAYVDEPERIERFCAEFAEELDCVDREQGYYEITPKGYSKATAIEYLVNRLGIPMEDTVAIGDSSNDMPMLECAHIAIAMGNSTQAALDIADYVTTDVKEDGIWNALKWLGI